VTLSQIGRMAPRGLLNFLTHELTTQVPTQSTRVESVGVAVESTLERDPPSGGGRGGMDDFSGQYTKFLTIFPNRTIY